MEFSPFIDLRNESDHSNELCDYNQVEGIVDPHQEIVIRRALKLWLWGKRC